MTESFRDIEPLADDGICAGLLTFRMIPHA